MRISSTGPDLTATIKFNGIEIYQDSPVSDPIEIFHDFEDNQKKSHVVEITLSGKMPDHTLIGDSGEILEDRMITVSDVSLDDIPLGHLLTTVAEYHHDNNGQGPKIVDRFYGNMGCNGTVKFSFTSPIYVWLLENM